ncbi:AAA family ATPase [uncultured Fretibacterium sp.]|uniref:AAA family ATPase n=1 Tax=uncultured Fretibacterium sp. TaxID=1678694 RepID=UPI00325F9CC6
MPKMTRLEIKKFRIFQNQTFHLGEMLTVISGQNGTGKSNLLGLIGNCVEYKKPRQRVSSMFNPRSFRTEFSELFAASQEYDLSGSNLMTFYFDDNDLRKVRITWQKHNKGKIYQEVGVEQETETKRFRIIPYKDIEGKRSSAKKQMASIYLGLSRLFPYGESEKCTNKSLRKSDPAAISWISERASRILSMTETVEDLEEVSVSETRRKKGIGFTTSNYDALANSAGQDNIGQILSAVWNIKALKTELGPQFPGAILLIDEIDATLHPASQIKLIKLLIEEARSNDFQVVCTTHSLYLLSYVTNKVQHNTPDENNIELIYLTKARGSLEIFRNPEQCLIENDLRENLATQPLRIKVYAEDDETRWFLRKLLEKHYLLGRLDIVEGVRLGCREAQNLFEKDPMTFNEILFICDGDASPEGLPNNFVRLPGESRPESVLMDFLCSQEESQEFYSQDGLMSRGINLRNLREKKRELLEQRQSRAERELYKEWFREMQPFFEEFHLFDFWHTRHQEETNIFLEAFINAFNRIAKRLQIPVVSPMANFQ